MRTQPATAADWLREGAARQARGDLGGAEAAFRAALKADPGHARAHAGLAMLLTRSGALTAAADHLKTWTRLEPANPGAFVELGLARVRLGEMEAARAAYDVALALDPEDSRARACQADLLEREGSYDAAYALVRPLLAGPDAGPDAAAVFARLAPRLGRAAEALALLEDLLARPTLRPEARPVLHFQAGALYDREGDPERAFAHYRAGNGALSGGFDRGAHRGRIDALIRAFAPDRMRYLPRASHASDLPVFIVGMPRSGTTLVEQIIASHPEAAGAGELPDVTDFTRLLPNLTGGRVPYPGCLEMLPRAAMDDLALRYLDRLKRLGPGARRVTDKMPQNFLHLGLIDLLCPGARVIHVRRDPRDCCLSCYFQPFVGDHGYARDLGDLGFYYREYERLMAHWDGVLRLRRLEVSYEALVAAPEATVREVIGFLGLPWDEACLRFHALDRTVATASYDQVRQPLYTGSVGRWRAYAAHLGPLLEALGTGPGADGPEG